MSKATANATKWRDAYGDEQALPIDEAADSYAAWVSGGRHGEDAVETAFEACKGYKYRIGGPGKCRAGWVLKTGNLGLGYYKDGVAEQRTLQLHDLLWPTAGLTPIELCLEEVVGHRKGDWRPGGGYHGGPSRVGGSQSWENQEAEAARIQGSQGDDGC